MSKRERRNENHKGNISGKPDRGFIKKIRDLYPGILLRDDYGKRAATPHEIQRALEGK